MKDIPPIIWILLLLASMLFMLWLYLDRRDTGNYVKLNGRVYPILKLVSGNKESHCIIVENVLIRLPDDP
jgi:ABC-type transport system involved in cytochrome c biogenesis permease component